MAKAKVYFTKNITPESLVRAFDALSVDLPGKVGVKISTGEAGNNNYLKPELIKDLIAKVNGTIVECNVAYEGGRDQTERHLETAREHGFLDIAEVDIMDAHGEIEIPVENHKWLPIDIVGEHIDNYDSFINLAHFKGHEMAGFGGVIKNQSIGFASASGKAYIHTLGATRSPEEMMAGIMADVEGSLAAKQDGFLEAMAETAKSVSDHVNGKSNDGQTSMVYIDVLNNLSVDCDCAATPEAPCMADIGIMASLDPVALDQAALDMVKNSNDTGREHFMERVAGQNGEHILEYATEIGFGDRDYELVNLD